jgi:hypothetical protein
MYFDKNAIADLEEFAVVTEIVQPRHHALRIITDNPVAALWQVISVASNTALVVVCVERFVIFHLLCSCFNGRPWP